MRKITLLMFLLCGLLFAANICLASIVTKPTPSASLADKWAGERDVRADQAVAVQGQQASILAEAKPMYDEQQTVEAKEQPLLDEKLKIGNAWEAHKAGKPAYEARCTSHVFKTPAEQAAFDSCKTEWGQREETRKGLLKRDEDNNAKLSPLAKHWKELEDKMEPYKLAYQDIQKKFAALEKEIRRLNALINKYSECTTLRVRARNEKDKFSQLELETLHLCESILFDGTDPNLLFHDPTIASLDPNLPPLNWKPTPLKIVPNK